MAVSTHRVCSDHRIFNGQSTCRFDSPYFLAVRRSADGIVPVAWTRRPCPGVNRNVISRASSSRCRRLDGPGAHRRHPLRLRRPDREQPAADGAAGGGGAAALPRVVRPPPLPRPRAHPHHQRRAGGVGADAAWSTLPIATTVTRGRPQCREDGEASSLHSGSRTSLRRSIEARAHFATRQQRCSRRLHDGDILHRHDGDCHWRCCMAPMSRRVAQSVVSSAIRSTRHVDAIFYSPVASSNACTHETQRSR